MEETVEKRGRGRPKKAESERRREIRTFVAPEDADRLAEIGAQYGVSPGAVLALLWRLVGELTMAADSGMLALALAKYISIVDARFLAPEIDAAINAGKVRVVLVDGVSLVDGESFRTWFLRR